MGEINQILGHVFVIGGPCLLVYSVISIIRTWSFLQRCVEVSGEIVRMEQSETRGRDGYTYIPVFSFTAADGRDYTVTSGVSTSAQDYIAGDFVKVRYDPANPEDARIHSFFQTWGSAVIGGLAGVILIVAGCNMLGMIRLGT
jgi:hypothetical protein